MPDQDSTQNPQSAPSGQVPDPTFNQSPSIEPSIVPNVQQSNLPDSTPVHTDLPPLPPDFQSITSEDSGSAAPSDLPPMITTPKKKFGSGKIIATILGALLLVGGVGTGIFLTQQQQIFQPKADVVGKHLCTCYGGSGCVSIEMTCAEYCGDSSRVKSDDACADVDGDTGGSGGTTSPDCGGKPAESACITGSDCHCQGGDACTSKICEPDIHQSCIDQGRAWCDNYQSGAGKTCCVKGYICYTGAGGGCIKPTNPPNPTSPPTPGPTPTAVCQSVKAYSSSWQTLTAAQLSALTSGTIINFCVTGTASSGGVGITKSGSTFTGGFDKGKFTINGVAQAETTTVRPNSTDFCQSYTIPVGVTTFNVTAQIHHEKLGWK